MKKTELIEKITALEDRLAELEKTKRRKRFLWLAAVVILPVGIWAAATIPNSFTDGETLSAEKLNANFQALAAKIDAMEGKSWRLIYETDVVSSATSINVSGLDGDTDKEYMIFARFVGAGSYYLRPNGDSNTANYFNQYLAGNNGTASAGRNATEQGLFMTAASSNLGVSKSFLYAKSGLQRVMLTELSQQISSTVVLDNETSNAVWNNSASNITSLLIYCTNASGIGAGSHIEIWARR